MFDDLAFDEIRELDSKLMSGFCKADFVYTDYTSRRQDPMVSELADISNDADKMLRYYRNSR
jgi:hypothetical protein